MSTLITRPTEAVVIESNQSVTNTTRKLRTSPTLLERLQLRVGLWLITRATVETHHTWTQPRNLEDPQLRRERDFARLTAASGLHRY